MRSRWYPVTLVVLTLLAGCGRDSHAPESAVRAGGQAVCAPVRIALLLDQTGSANWTRTPQLRPEDLEPLIELVKRCGGELGLGLIRDQSNRSLVRLRLEQPPEPPGAANPLRAVKARPAYEKRRRQWEAETAEQIGRFREAAARLLAQPADARCTDVWGAVLRADLFLAEEDGAWGAELSRWAVLVTDGQHNCGGEPVRMRSQARVAVVNGSASLGSLAALKPARFESPQAAFRYLIASAEQKETDRADRSNK
ncbi:MAG: hypothetical protein ACUVXB_16460 [Bryobacteraceae bacterium]